MANRYWIASSSGNWNDTANWSTTSGGSGGASVPGSGDNAYFDGNGVGGCRLNTSINVLYLEVLPAYTGHFDAGTDDLDHTVGSFRLESTGSTTYDFGTGTWTYNGPGTADLDNCLPGAVTGDSLRISSGGSFTLDIDGNDARPYSLIVNNGHTVTTSSNGALPYNTLTVSGVFHVAMNSSVLLFDNAYDLTVNNGGSITGNNISLIYYADSATINVTVNGSLASFSTNAKNGTTINVSGTGSIDYFEYQPDGGPFGCTLNFGTSVPSIGDLTLKSAHVASPLTINNTNNANLDFSGDIDIGGGVGTDSYNKGTGTITFSGASAQTADFNGLTVEDIDIDKTAGTVTLTGNVTTDSLTVSSGALDIDTYTLTTTGNVSASANTTLKDTTGGGLIDCGGNIILIGAAGNLITINNIDFDVTGTFNNITYCDVINSDASAGTALTANYSIDGGGNAGWTFNDQVTIVDITQNEGLTSTFTVPYPSSIDSGDLLLVQMTVALSGSITLSGWTAEYNEPFDTGSAENAQLGVFTKIAAGTESGNISGTIPVGTSWAVACTQIKGADGSTPIDVKGKQEGYGTTITCPSVTTTVDDALVLSLSHTDEGDFTEGSGYPSGTTGLYRFHVSATSPGIGAAYEYKTTAGATTARTWSLDANDQWAGVTLAIAPAATGAYTLTAAAGSYALTGQTASLLADRSLSAVVGTYALTGQNVNLLADRKLTADQGSYILTGQDVNLLADRKLTADQGSYVLTGYDATLTYSPLAGYTLTAETGTYALTGNEVTLVIDRTISAETGAYSLTGYDATLTYTPIGAYILTADSGSYTLTGQDVGLVADRLFIAGVGAYTQTGYDIGLYHGYQLTADSGSYLQTGYDVDFLRGYALNAESGGYDLTGYPVGLSYSGFVYRPPIESRRIRIPEQEGKWIKIPAQDRSFEIDE